MKASVLYAFIGATGLRLEHDVIGFGLHAVLNALLFAGAVRVVRDRLTGGDTVSALLAVLLSCFFYTKLATGVRATPISYITPTPSGLGHMFGMAALFLGLARRPVLATLAATLCIAIAPKGNILIIPALMAWLVLDRSLPRWSILWAVIPLGYIAHMAGVADSGLSHDQKRFMTEVILLREEEDASFLEQPLLANLLLTATMAAAVWAGRRSQDPTLRSWLWALTLAAFGGWLVMTAYPLGLYKLFPVPALAAMSIPQSTKHFVWLAMTLGTARILCSQRLNALEKLLLLLAIFALRPYPLHAALALALAAAAGLSFLLRHRRGHGPDLPLRLSLALPLLLGGFVLARSGVTYVGPNLIDRLGFAQYGSWTAGVFADESAWRAWRALASEPDYPLLALYRNTAKGTADTARWNHNKVPHIVARKSSFYQLPAHAYINPDLWFEAQRRELVTYELLRLMEAGRSIAGVRVGTVPSIKERYPIAVESSVEDFLAERRARLLVPEELSPLFPDHLPRRLVEGHVLIGFGGPP